MIKQEDLNKIEGYTPEADVRKFLLDAYSDYEDCRELRLEPQGLLGDVSLNDFWDRSNYDYGVLVDGGDINDPVKQYSSNISRDKANDFIASLTGEMIIPTVIAQNQNQEIDRVVSKISRSLLEWAYLNDGRPSKSGHKKMVEYIHKMVVEGTVHVQDDIIDGKLESSLVPNDEIYINNFWQNDLQKQSLLMRVQDKVHYYESRAMFGELENFKYVIPGAYSNWTKDQDVLFKEYGEGIIDEEEVQIVRIWRDIPKSQFKKYKVPKGQKKAKLFNIMINGVLMFPPNNLSPYRDGLYPISKEIFESHSKVEYYWGNSMPNKAKYDKEFLDGWKTLIRHKAKLSAIPPLLTFNGQYMDTNIFIPGTVNQAPNGMKPEDIQQVPGINLNGVSPSDMEILQDAKNEIESGNISGQAAGKSNPNVGTATEAIILQQNEQKILGSFGLRVAFLIEQRAFPILKRLYQFLPREKMKKIAVPNQNLGEGKNGTMEVIMEKIPKMTKDDASIISKNILKEEQDSEMKGEPKKIIFLDPRQLENLELYVSATSEVKPKPTDALRRMEAMEKYNLYIQNPNLFNQQSVGRTLVRAMGDDEQDLLNQQQEQTPPIEQTQQNNQLNNIKGQERTNMRNVVSNPQQLNVNRN